MLIFEAKNIIDERLKLNEDYKEHIPEYFNALEIASKALDAQLRLADMINDLSCDREGSTYSQALVLEILNECSIEGGKGDEDEN